MAKKLKAPVAVKRATKLGKQTLRSALVSGLKEKSGRKDLKFTAAPEVAGRAVGIVPIEKRAGYPLCLPDGAVDPEEWKTKDGVKVEVDFARVHWLPDEWGQGVKTTCPTARSTGGGGGTLTAFVSPDMTVYYHKCKVEEYVGRPLTERDGFNGQVRLAQLQAEQAINLARMQIKEMKEGSSSKGTHRMIGTDRDADFFKLLSQAERRHLPAKEDFHFCVVSARRATKLEGVRDIFTVQTQLVEAGVKPTWYVDEESLAQYKALGLHAVVGGKLTQARNKALEDAKSSGKICVQLSDDISAWEYRHGERASEKNDKAANAAHAAARRFIVTPVAAARFIAAKMRASAEKPKLGGVYMLGSCARAFSGEEFGRQHFILGDFLVVDKDCAFVFLEAHGSVLRCNRMTLSVKHYSNSGGAVSTRDKKGEEEKRNIAILFRKWPGAFRMNPKRKNEVIMRWKSCRDDDDVESERITSTETGRAIEKQNQDRTRKVRKTIKKATRGGA
ncbi:unnamed protein product [Effrenium voratum]|nr:unnamed protein product [Effrenium voratum]